MGILEQYESYYNKYREIYGERIAILFQVGSFHQLYGIDNEQEHSCNLCEIAGLLNIKETRVNTSILENSRSNPQLAGFNSVSLDSNVERLVSYGYTVVVINQTEGSVGGEIKRDVAYIQSPSTIIDMNAARDPYLISVFLTQEHNKTMARSYDYIGMAAMDITTGQSFYYEAYSSPCDPDLAIDNLKRFFQTFSPVEVIVHAPDGTHIPPFESWGFRLSHEKTSVSDIKPIAYLNCHLIPDINKIAFQEQTLTDLLGIQNPLETMSMTQLPLAVKALVHLLRFCADHNTSLMKSLNRPMLWGSGNHLVLDTRSILQLGILESYYDQLKTDSVYAMLSSWAATSVGRRTLRHRLLNGITDIDELNRRYDDIALMYGVIRYEPDKITVTATSTDCTIPVHDFVYQGFRGIKDLDRMHRKLTLGSLTPSEFYDLDLNYRQILRILEQLPTNIRGQSVMETLKLFKGQYQDILNLEECGRCTVTEHMRNSIFKPEVNREIDTIAEDINYCEQVRTELLQVLSDLVAKGSNCCKYRGGGSNEALTGCWITLTKPQYVKFDSAFPAAGLNVKNYHVSRDSISVDTRNKSNIKIELTLLDDLQKKQDSLISRLRTLSIAEYQRLLDRLSKLSSNLTEIANSVGILDLNQAIARISLKHGYCRPEISGSNAGSLETLSWLEVEQLRHPLVERKCAYVPHDIKLGNADGGMLLYGVNQSGKSCTMKSVGIAVVLAQAGFYVPAKSFRYYPYRNLMTRIIGNDSIDNGLSSYAVEMMELRSILTRSNGNTLVLGDEVCHGTESASAVSLVAASLIHLDKGSTSFIFATHLHELSQMQEVAHIRQFHITVKFSSDGKIIYDRQFKTGSGTGLYGIEVAKHLRLPTEVIHDALMFRNKYFKNPDVKPLPVQSKYNSDKFISMCEIRGCKSKAEHTHHIRYQSEASDVGLIDGYRDLNQKENLMGLCTRHHEDVHHSNLEHLQLVIFDREHYEYRRKLYSLDRIIDIPTNI